MELSGLYCKRDESNTRELERRRVTFVYFPDKLLPVWDKELAAHKINSTNVCMYMQIGEGLFIIYYVRNLQSINNAVVRIMFKPALWIVLRHRPI